MSNKRSAKLPKSGKLKRLDRTIVGNILPRDLRVSSADDAGLSLAESHLNEFGASCDPSNPQIVPPAKTDEEKQKFLRTLRDVALDTWRLRSKVIDPDTKEPRDEMRRLHRHIESIIATLEDAGITIVDSYGEKFDSGMALKAISFEEKPGIMKEEIIETIKPTIRYQNGLLQVGEVIVGTPAKQ